MKVIVVHNYYQRSVPSGENSAVDSECALLKSKGHCVRMFSRESDDLADFGRARMARMALQIPWNSAVAGELRSVIDDFKPDIVHVHNTFPMISPAIFSVLSDRAAVALTLHNYRLFCAKAIPMRGGSPCTKCLDRKVSWPAIWHACYRDSRVATVPAAMNVGLHRLLRTWERHVDVFIALTVFQRDLMVKAGLPAANVVVRPNCFPGDSAAMPWDQRGSHVLFAGRVSVEKGVDLLVDAWLEWGSAAPELRIVGDGPLLASLSARTAQHGATNVRFVGRLSEAETQAEIARASLLVVPSVWYEGFPLVIGEALAFGTPVAVAEIGALPEIVESGVSGISFRAGDRGAMIDAISAVVGTRHELARLGSGARRTFEEHYSDQAGYESLMAIYEQTIARKAESRAS